MDEKLISKILDVLCIMCLVFLLLFMYNDIEKLKNKLDLQEQTIIELQEDVTELNAIINSETD